MNADQISGNEYNDDADKIKLNLNLGPDTLQTLSGKDGVKIRNQKDSNSHKFRWR